MKVRSIEFWLFALPALMIFTAWLSSYERIGVTRYLIPGIAVVWSVLAVIWMLREIVRQIRD